MNEIFRYIIVSTFVASLIAAGNVLPRVYAQSSSSTSAQTPSCPTNAKPIGFLCVPFTEYKLPLGNWQIEVNGFGGILNISSIDSTGKINGTMFGSGSLCTIAFPCIIDGSFDGRSGKINFTSHTTIPTFIAVINNYTGQLFQKVMIDFTVYTLVGIGTTVSPVPGTQFGWDATISCISPSGPCVGGFK